ncbi:MAG: transposase [Synergistaceae bacterium]|nr:transposase [Synergistaceae bacterium]
MQYAEVWSAGNFISTLFPDAELSSQRISDFLEELGKESHWRNFFSSYIKCVAGDKVGIIADSTGMPNEIDIPVTAWGNHGGDTQLETRLLMVIDKDTGRPLYFRYMAGNIVDVSTLKNTIAELSEMGVKTSYALIDAGYYSEANIRALYSEKISFLTRLPANRKLYNNLIATHTDIESVKNAVIYGGRALYVKKVEVDLYENKGFAYVICDIRRKGDETTKYLISAKEDGLSDEEMGTALNEKGKFILISSEDVPISEIIPMYYTRQTAEKLFGVSKSFIDLLPLRTHKIETLRGYLMLTFITLLIYLEMKSRLKGKFTVERAIVDMGNLMSKSYGNHTIICEPNKNMKAIAELLGFMVPMTLGV